MKVTTIMNEFKFLKDYGLMISGLVIASLLAALLEGVGIASLFPLLSNMSGSEQNMEHVPDVFRGMYQLFAGMSTPAKLQLAAMLIFGSTLLRGVCVWTNLTLSAKLTVIVIKHFRMRCAKQLMDVGMTYFNKQKAADLQLITDGYTNSTAGTTVNMIATVIPVILTSLMLLGFLMILSWPLTLLSIGLVAIAALSISRFSKLLAKLSQSMLESGYRYNQIVFDLIQGMRLIRLFSREPHMVGRFEQRVDDYNGLNFRITRLSGFIPVLFEISGIGVLAIIILAAAWILPWKEGQTGILFTFLIVLARLITPMKTLLQTASAIIPKMPAFEELIRFLSLHDKAYLSQGKRPFTGLTQGIKFEDVHFQYRPELDPVLKGLNLSITKGIRLGLVGPSGSGKSTTIDLLFRFYDPTGGVIKIDDMDLREYDVASWRRSIGVVSQDTFLFNDTIHNNIAFACPKAPKEDIIMAAKKAHIHDFIMTLKDGYETYLGDRGVNISGGQRQRIAIARAILSGPEILILDEATSALDTEAERAIQETLEEVTIGKTVIAIAHRLSTLNNFDLIAVLNQGQIEEIGSPQQLKSKEGYYSRLMSQQSLKGDTSL